MWSGAKLTTRLSMGGKEVGSSEGEEEQTHANYPRHREYALGR